MMEMGLFRWENPNDRPGHFRRLAEFEVKAAHSEFQSVSVHLLTQNDQRPLDVLYEYCRTNKPTLIHFDWAHDFSEHVLEIASMLAEISVPWTSTASIGRALRKSNNARRIDLQTPKLFYKLNYAFQSATFRGLFLFDDILVNRFQSKYVFLNQLRMYEDLSTADTCDYCDVISTRPLIGVAGTLFGYRGSEQLLRYWKQNNNFRIALFGEYIPSTHSPYTQNVLKEALPDFKNLIRLGRVNSDRTFNHLLNHLDGIYLDTRDYPEPSGIIARAMSFGIPVIIEDADSYLNDQMKNNPLIVEASILADSAHHINQKLTHVSKLGKVLSAFSVEDTIRDFSSVWRDI